MSEIKELTIGEFQAVHSISESALPWIDKMIQVVGLIFQMTVDEVEALPVEKFNELNSQVNTILENTGTRYISEPLIKIGDQTYKVTTKPSVFKAGPVLSIQSLYRADPIGNLHKMFAELLQPVADISVSQKTRRKTEQEATVLPDLVKELPFAYIMSICQFFKDFWNVVILDMKPKVAKELHATESLNMDENAANDAADKLTRSIILE